MTSGVLASLPPVFILPTHISSEEQFEVENKLTELGCQLTYDPKEARIFLARITQKKRANFDLRARGIWTEEITSEESEPPNKRRRIETTSSTGLESSFSKLIGSQEGLTVPAANSPSDKEQATSLDSENNIVILKIDWLNECFKRHSLIPLNDYTIYRGRVIPRPNDERQPEVLSETATYVETTPSLTKSTSFLNTTGTLRVGTTLNTILSRARAEAANASSASAQTSNNQRFRRRFNQSSTPSSTHPNKPPKLHRTTTSEFEDQESRSAPEPPDWVRSRSIYACRRSTPLNPVNVAFLTQLYKIKEARLLTLDSIGVRAYSTAIASISAYPHLLTSNAEVARIPGCENKIASLWHEWHHSASTDAERGLEVVRQIDADEDLKHLRLFFEIWGVGADTARRFYFNNGWRDLDDVVEYGWATLTRVQQIGVKFYDEFQIKIPRPEVEEIADVILRHARSCREIPERSWDTDEDMVCVIVGGYRRGKPLCGDVDVILSHRNEKFTKDLVLDVVASLEVEGWITHTLTLHTTTSDRNQQTLPFRGGLGHGHGFDSLDKALCVWQDPSFSMSREENNEDAAKVKNPNIHRRVDIIVSAWGTVGCAVLGWSGATTFERDIRRWCKREKGWKFDSSGIRDRATGLVVDFETPRHEGDGDSWLDREKRLMDGLGIGWREPTERCTG